jgi:hypothetical protein
MTVTAHPVRTDRMGSDEDATVKLRVHRRGARWSSSPGSAVLWGARGVRTLVTSSDWALPSRAGN